MDVLLVFEEEDPAPHVGFMDNLLPDFKTISPSQLRGYWN